MIRAAGDALGALLSHDVPNAVVLRSVLRRPITLRERWLVRPGPGSPPPVVRYLEAQRYSICWSHHVAEPAPRRPYRVCFECGHVYARASDLLAAYRREHDRLADCTLEAPPLEHIVGEGSAIFDLASLDDWPDPGPVTSADDVFFCQECVHDF